MKNNFNDKNILKGKSGEHYFLYEALKRKLNVSYPIQEDNRYDLILDNGKKLLKIQLKSCFNPKIDIMSKGKYQNKYERYFFRLAKAEGKTYNKKDVDFIICFLDPTKDFYILPIKIATKIKSLTLNKSSKKESKYEKYKNNWKLLE